VPRRGYARLFHESVTQADQGCDFDFLIGTDEGEDPTGR
jgi:dihydroxy-acid dehydratase